MSTFWLRDAREAVRRLAGRVQCMPLLLLATACLVIEEEYPFSHYPMYSSFSSSTYYVYLADGSGKPLPSFSTIGLSTATLKKIYQGELRREAHRLRTPGSKLTDDNKRVVAERVLGGFRTSAAAGTIGGLPEVLRLYEVEIRLVEKELRKETKLIAELP